MRRTDSLKVSDAGKSIHGEGATEDEVAWHHQLDGRESEELPELVMDSGGPWPCSVGQSHDAPLNHSESHPASPPTERHCNTERTFPF